MRSTLGTTEEDLSHVVIGHDGAEQGMRAHVVDCDGNDLADKPRIAVEHDDPVTGRAAGELDEIAFMLAAPLGAVAGALDEDGDSLAKEPLVLLLTNAI